LIARTSILVVMPAKAGIQYTEASSLNREGAAYWIIRLREDS